MPWIFIPRFTNFSNKHFICFDIWRLQKGWGWFKRHSDRIKRVWDWPQYKKERQKQTRLKYFEYNFHWMLCFFASAFYQYKKISYHATKLLFSDFKTSLLIVIESCYLNLTEKCLKNKGKFVVMWLNFCVETEKKSLFGFF